MQRLATLSQMQDTYLLFHIYHGYKNLYVATVIINSKIMNLR